MHAVSFRRRRFLSLAITAIGLTVLWLWVWFDRSRLSSGSLPSGASLLCCLLILTLLGVRRRIPVLRLGSVSTWTQVHLYTGLFAVGVYVMHVPAIIANGIFESALSIVFLVVSLSGIVGLWISRSIPRRLTAMSQQYRYDRIGWHRKQIADAAGALIDALVEPTGVQVIGDFHKDYLHGFFQSKPGLSFLLFPNGVRRRRLLSGLQELHRYLEPESRGKAGELASLVRRRDDLDYQFALQTRLRCWVLVHSLFSIALVIGSLIHVVVALRFIA